MFDNTSGRQNMLGMPAAADAVIAEASDAWLPPASMPPAADAHSAAGNGIRLSSDPSVPRDRSMVMLLFFLLNFFQVHSLGMCF